MKTREALAPQDAGGLLFGRFRPVRTLKERPGLRTILATDLQTGTNVVVKVSEVPPDQRVADSRLGHEAVVLSRLEGPYVAPLWDFGQENGVLYVVTPLIPGTSLEQRLRDGPMGVRDAVTLGICLMRALHTAHEAGVVHRDVKPSNIIVGSSSPLEIATLIDFDLARSDDLDPSVRDVPAGTARYMAPEQAGLLESAVDERSDLYAAGGVLYECLAGRPAFDGETLGEMLRQHVSTKPADLREIGADVPRAVDELVQRLLAKDPRDRYQSAAGALADFEEIAAALDRGEVEPPVVVGVRDRRHSLAEPAFVGRDYELSSLRAQLERARHGHGAVVLVEAESGGGKTRLLAEFAQRAALQGARVFRGQGTDQAAQRPFEVLRGVAQGILAVARTQPNPGEYLRKRLGDRRDAACGALPELTTLLQARTDQLGPEEFGETRTLEALEALITSLGSPDHPALLVLDDCQWADELTLKLLARWNADAHQQNRHVLVAVAMRSEEVGPEHVLRTIENPIRLELTPLRSGDVQQLVESMAGTVPPEVIPVVVDLAEGSPFMAAAVLRGLVESGALVDTPTGWETNADALAEATASRRAGALLARRLSLLSAATMSVLRAGAVLGKEFDVHLAAALAETSDDEVLPALGEARRRHLVWVRGSSCAFVHDKIRETVLAELPHEDHQALHRQAAELIQMMDADRVFEIAYHLDAGGESVRALPFAIEAAERARSHHALAIAQRNYEIAERAAAGSGDQTKLRVIEGLGDVLMLRGRYEDAGPRFDAAAELVPDALTGARIAGKIGELAFKKGDVRSGTESLQRALRMLGHGTPRRLAGFLLRLPWEIVVQVTHTLAPRLFVGRRCLDRADGDMLAVKHYDRLAYAYWFYRGPLPALWAHLRGLNLAERYQPTPELAKSLSTHSPALTLIVPLMPKRALRYATRARDLSHTSGDLWGEAQAMHFCGIAYYTTGRYDECIKVIGESVRLFERAGDRWEANIASFHRASSFAYLGDRPAAIEAARVLHRSGVEIGDPQARGFGLAVWARASKGRVPEDLVRTDLERPTDDTLTASEVALTEAIRLIESGRPGEAADILRAAIRRMVRAQMIQTYVVTLFPWLATALRLQAEQTSMYGRANNRAARRRWFRAASYLSVIARVYPNDRAHSWREAALAAAASGRTRRARRLFGRSLAAAERFGQRRERAQTLIELGRIGAELAWPGAGAYAAEGEELMRSLSDDRGDAAVTVSLLDRFDSVLVEGRRIASALSADAVYDAVRDAAMTLLRPERCAVLEVGADGDLRPVAGSAGEFSQTIARRALDEGRPVVVSEEEAAGDVSESLVLAGVRSSLAAPIFVRGRAAVCFYIEHRAVAGLFGADEERIAEFIATVAGAALENAEGFAEIHDLTQTLERRVADRTTELADTNVRLEETLTDLRRLDQLKTEFMAMAAHDLRTPLTVIAGFAATLRDSWEEFGDDDKRLFMYRINANTKRLSEFVENLLHFARIESGELSYDIRPFDLPALVRRTVTEQSSAIGASRFSVSADDALPRVLGDEERIWQVLTNLVSNAVKFSGEDTPIDVSLRLFDGSLHVSIADRGPGISPGDRDKLFRKFSRIERPDGTKGPLGTGLGLYICKSIIEAQNGEMGVTTAPGEGSTFTFSLPVAPTAGDPALTERDLDPN